MAFYFTEQIGSKVCEMYLFGLIKKVKGYRLWNLVVQRLVVSFDVSFNEVSSLKERDKSENEC